MFLMRTVTKQAAQDLTSRLRAAVEKAGFAREGGLLGLEVKSGAKGFYLAYADEAMSEDVGLRTVLARANKWLDAVVLTA